MGSCHLGQAEKSTHLHVAKAPGPVNDQEFFDEVSVGEKKETVSKSTALQHVSKRGGGE